MSTRACILNFDLEQNFRGFLQQKGGFHKRQSPKLKGMKETYTLSCLTLLLGRINFALKRLQISSAITVLLGLGPQEYVYKQCPRNVLMLQAKNKAGKYIWGVQGEK